VSAPQLGRNVPCQGPEDWISREVLLLRGVPIGPGPHGVRAASREDPHGGSTIACPHESGFWPRMFCRDGRALLEVRGSCGGGASCAARGAAAALLASCGSSCCERCSARALTLAAVARVSHLASAVRKSSSCDARWGAGSGARWARSGAAGLGRGSGRGGGRGWGAAVSDTAGLGAGRTHKRGARGRWAGVTTDLLASALVKLGALTERAACVQLAPRGRK
jgi:hypothetical protein